jgi:DUF1680 family protein
MVRSEVIMADRISRRAVLRNGMQAGAAMALPRMAWGALAGAKPLEEVGYGQVTMKSPLLVSQRESTHAVLMGLDNVDLVKPYRVMCGMKDAPGEDLGGWYTYNADFNYRVWQRTGFCPGHTLGQWVSAMSRYYATTGDAATRDKVLAINKLYASTGMCSAEAAEFYAKTRFIAYTYDKLTCGLVDSATLVKDPEAWKILGATTDQAVKALPGHAVEYGTHWRAGKDDSYSWDESYTLPENLYRAYSAGAGARYRQMAAQYLDDPLYFDPLAKNEPVIAGKHAYSHVNAMSSAMQAYLVEGSDKHLRAAKNGFAMVQAQSFATGGWGPDELLRKPGSEDVFDSLTKSHNSFETPCGAYGHMKLTRYLLRVTRDGRYGDSLERVLWNTVLGALPLRADGTAFYYQDLNFEGTKKYSDNVWPCCSGTLPQVANDYGICSYFRESGAAHGHSAVWVSQYFESELRWQEDGSPVLLEQRAPQGQAAYPLGDTVEFRVSVEKPTRFALKLRILAWCEKATIYVNGAKVPVQPVLGFATVQQVWRDGDRVELELPAKVRLEQSFAAHPEVVAVMYGPLVLFAQMKEQPKITKEQALGARRVSSGVWVVDTASGPLKLVPYTDVGDAEYATYLRMT